MVIKKFDEFLNEDVSPDSTEAYIDKTLKPIIAYCKDKMFTEEAKKAGKIKDEDVLGKIVSKFCRWDGDKIITVAASALEDANYSDLADQVKKL
jgi:hypothetical protein